MARGNRADGGAHEMIDQILALSQRQVPSRVLAVPRPGDTAHLRYMRQAIPYARSALVRKTEADARESALSVFANQERTGHMCWPGDKPDALGYRNRIEQMAADPHYGFHVA